MLGCYLSAACLFVLWLRTGKEMSVTLPLVCGGTAMLPSAMGRCDIGHLESAWPAMLVGIFAIYALLAVRRWYVPAMWLILVLPGDFQAVRLVARPLRDAGEFLLVGSGGVPIALQRFIWTHLEGGASMKTHLAAISAKLALRERYDNAVAPCDRIYLAPAYGRMLGPCLDGGYFLGQANLSLPAQIQRKIDELAAHPNAPLLLPDRPLQDTFPVHLDEMQILTGLEGSFFVPRQRNPSLSLAPLAQYISEHYVPAKTLDGAGYTVWEPKGRSALLADRPPQ